MPATGAILPHSLHITLLSGADLKAWPELASALRESLLAADSGCGGASPLKDGPRPPLLSDLAAAAPVLATDCVPRLAKRGAAKSTAFLRLRDQAAWRDFASHVVAAAAAGGEAAAGGGLAPSPQPSLAAAAAAAALSVRLFHVSFWNSEGGDPRRSIGDIESSDDKHGSVFAQHFGKVGAMIKQYCEPPPAAWEEAVGVGASNAEASLAAAPPPLPPAESMPGQAEDAPFCPVEMELTREEYVAARPARHCLVIADSCFFIARQRESTPCRTPRNTNTALRPRQKRISRLASV
jgi:hypothetical protein